MQKIYIDITSVLQVDFVTGIQRVVKNVLLEMYKIIPEKIVLINFNAKKNNYEKINVSQFINYSDGKNINVKDVFKNCENIEIGENMCGDIFFDIDSVWNSEYKRSVLLPILKGYGVKLAVYIYDIIPVTDSKYCHADTIFNFLNYLGAYLQYADVIIASTQSTINEIYNLMDYLKLERIPAYVSWLGSDFKRKNKQEYNILDEVLEASERKFILSVGTIEPRKNHAYLLDAFDQGLYSDDLNLVFVGRIGWNVEQVIQRIKNHPMYGKQLFYFKGLDDDNVGYLYKKAFVVGFPTFNEGFGLPIVEALERGAPVMATDRAVLKEVGGEYCRYFDPTCPKQFIEKVRFYLKNGIEYEKWKHKIENYIPFTWKETSNKIIEALDTLIVSDK